MVNVQESSSARAVRRNDPFVRRRAGGTVQSGLKTLIASNSQVIASALAERLCQLGPHCSPSSALSIPAAIESLQAEHADADLVFLVLSSEFSESLADIQRMRSQTGAKIVAVGAARSPREALQLIRAGASDVVGNDNQFADLQDLLSRVTQQVRAGKSSGALTMISSACGGAGKSVLCANLGVLLAEHGCNCGLLDLNLRGGDLATLLNVKPRHTVDDLLDLRDSLDRSMFEQSLTDHQSGLRLLASPAMLSSRAGAATSDLGRIVEISKSTFDFTIIDISHAAMMELPDWLDAVDQVLLVTRLDFLAMVRTRKYMMILERAGAPPQKLRLVANRYGQLCEVPLDKVQQALQSQISYFVPDDPRTINGSINVGAPFVTESPSSKVADSINMIAEHLMDMSASPSGARPMRDLTKTSWGKVLAMLGVA